MFNQKRMMAVLIVVMVSVLGACSVLPGNVTSAPPPELPVEPSDISTGEGVELIWDTPPEMTINTDRIYLATLRTAKGDITIELFDDLAPKTVNNFVFLAEAGFYDNTTFHRVITGFMAQGGIRQVPAQEALDIPSRMRSRMVLCSIRPVFWLWPTVDLTRMAVNFS